MGDYFLMFQNNMVVSSRAVMWNVGEPVTQQHSVTSKKNGILMEKMSE